MVVLLNGFTERIITMNSTVQYTAKKYEFCAKKNNDTNVKTPTYWLLAAQTQKEAQANEKGFDCHFR